MEPEERPARQVRWTRPAGAADAPALRALFAAANEEHRPHVPPTIYRNYLRNLVDLVGDDPPPGMLVVEAAGAGVVGTGTVVPDGASLHAVWPAGCFVLRAMAVDPAHRGVGVGAEVARACLELAVSGGASAVVLHTATFMGDATRLYRSLGFRRVPEHDARIDELFGPAGEPYEDRATAFRLDLREVAS